MNKTKICGMLVAAIALLVVIFLGMTAPLFAHHSVTAEFDPNQEWTATGVLKKVD